jgi:GNAT superfamily N-acetyltransferase
VNGIQIRPIDPTDPAAFDAWHAVYLAAESFGREEWANPRALEEFRADRAQPVPYRSADLFAGVVDGEVVVVGGLELSLIDRPEHASLQVFTHPSHRQRGYGSRMLDTLEAAAQAQGRRVFDAEAAYPYDGPADGAGSAGVEFARRHGYAFGLGDVMRVLELPVSTALLESLLAEAAPHHTSYTLRNWVGHVPDDLALDWVRLDASLDTEAPIGDLVKAPNAADLSAQRAREEVLDRQQRTAYHCVAVASDGRLAAYNLLVLPALDPGRVFQWGTLVAQEYRGHRLGLAIKAANLLQLQASHREPLLLTTYNAEVNSHMIGINERLGFRPVERLGEFQKTMPR